MKKREIIADKEFMIIIAEDGMEVQEDENLLEPGDEGTELSDKEIGLSDRERGEYLSIGDVVEVMEGENKGKKGTVMGFLPTDAEKVLVVVSNEESFYAPRQILRKTGEKNVQESTRT